MAARLVPADAMDPAVGVLGAGVGGKVAFRKESGGGGGPVESAIKAREGVDTTGAGCDDGGAGAAGELAPAVAGLPALLLLALIRLSQDARIVSASASRLSGGCSM
jgi:hypothetical protein